MKNSVATTIFCLLLLTGCADFSDEKTKVFTKTYASGWRIKVFKLVKRYSEKWSFGYNQKTLYRYSLTLSPNDIKWTGYTNAEPKNILIYQNAIYLHYIQNKADEYVLHVDNRYFFNYFGTQSWKNVPKVEYTKTEEKCSNLLVPNDNWSNI